MYRDCGPGTDRPPYGLGTFIGSLLWPGARWVGWRGPGRRSGAGPATAADVAGGADDVVDEAVLLRLLRGEPAVPVGVALDGVDGLAAVGRDQLGHLPLDVQDLLGLDLDVGRRAADAAERLVHHHPGVREG